MAGIDFSKLSDADLQAISSNQLSKVSTEGLQYISGQSAAAPKAPTDQRVPSQREVPTRENLELLSKEAQQRQKREQRARPWYDRPLGMLEAPVSAVTGGLATVAAPWESLAKGAVTKGAEMVGAITPERRKELLSKTPGIEESIAARTYMPRTQTGREILGGAGRALEATKIPPVLTPELQMLSGAGRGVGTQVAGPTTRAVQAVAQPIARGAEAVRERLPSLPKLPPTRETAVEKAQALRQALGGATTTAELAEQLKRTRQEIGLRRAGEKFATGAEAQREASAREFSNLGRPTAEGTLGDEMQRRIVGTEFRRESARSRQATNDFAEYFQQARGFEDSDQRQIMLQRLESMSQSAEAGSAGRSYAAKALKDLEQSDTAIGAEKEFRKYFQEASAPQQAGFGAIEQQANRAISEIISDALNSYAPKRVDARKTYAEFSTPLDAYETLLGKKAVAAEKGVPGRLAMKPSDYPSAYFKDRDTINSLREQLAGDEAAVRKFANQYAVNELQGKTASQAKTWLKNNSSWIDTVEGLNTRINRYVENLAVREAEAEKLGKRATVTEKKAGTIVTEGEKARTKIREDFKQLELLDPDKIPTKAKQIVRDLKDQNLIEKTLADSLEKEIQVVEKTFAGAEKRERILSALKKRAILAAIGYGGYEVYSASRRRD